MPFSNNGLKNLIWHCGFFRNTLKIAERCLAVVPLIANKRYRVRRWGWSGAVYRPFAHRNGSLIYSLYFAVPTNNGKKIVCFVSQKKISYIYNIYVQKICTTKKNRIDIVSIILPCKKYWLCILIRYNISELRLTLYMFCSWFPGTQKNSRCSGFFFTLFPYKNIAVPLWLGKGHVTSII